MIRSLLIAAIALGAAALPACAQDMPVGNADSGKKIYMADGCFLCHGRVG